MTKEEALAIINGEHKESVRKIPTQWEHAIQTSCVVWFRLQYPNGLIFSIPNGAYCGVRQARKLKAEGMTKGYPDLCIPMARHGYNHLYIEMKNGKKGVLSDDQKSIIAFLESQGSKCIVCRSFDDFTNAVNAYLC